MSRWEIRRLQVSDLHDDYFEIIHQLSPPEDESYVYNYLELERWFSQLNDEHRVYILYDMECNKIVGTSTLLLEKKLSHNFGTVAHIEDVIIHNQYRGHGLGKMLIEYLKYKADIESCYKIVLDCLEDNVEFYEKCGFTQYGRQMVIYS